jgi:2-enoate reductase
MNPTLITDENVVVIGGGLVGSEAALWLAQQGKKVTLIEADDDIIGGPHGTCFANYQMLKELLVKENVTVHTSTKLESITDKGVILQQANQSQTLHADHVVLALGYKSNDSLYGNLANELDVEEVFNIGDSQKARTIMTAIWDGYEVARSL